MSLNRGAGKEVDIYTAEYHIVNEGMRLCHVQRRGPSYRVKWVRKERSKHMLVHVCGI